MQNWKIKFSLKFFIKKELWGEIVYQRVFEQNWSLSSVKLLTKIDQMVLWIGN